MKSVKLIAVLCTTLLTIWACDTRCDIHSEGGTWVVVNFDWSDLEKTPNGATALFYPQTRSVLSPSYLSTNYQQDKIFVKRDFYNVLVMNETTSSHANMTFSNKSSYDEFAARLTDLNVTIDNYDQTFSCSGEPDILTVERYTGLEVTRESVINGESYEMTFAPKQITKNLRVLLYLRGIDNLGSSSQSVVIDGMSKGIFINSGESTGEQTSHHIGFLNGVLDDETGDSGYLYGSINCFGTIDNATNKVKVILNLRDESTFEIEYDASGKIYSDSDNESQLYLEIYDEALSSEGQKVGFQLPEVEAPNDDNNDSGGFGASVDDWGNEEDVPVTAN
ncbi:MAG: DUF5119 domain-containing protein [Rikenellaceae bacterium]